MALSMALIACIAVLLLLMLAFLLLLLLLACKPWRLFYTTSSRASSSFSSPAIRSVKDDIEKPLVSEECSLGSDQTSDLADALSASSLQNEGNFSSPSIHGLASNQRNLSSDSHSGQGASLILDVLSDSSEDLLVGQTLKRSDVANWPAEDIKFSRKEESNYEHPTIRDSIFQVSGTKTIQGHGSCLTLEVISGPSSGLRCTIRSTNSSQFPLILGRIPPSGLLVKDSEVSGKHAMVNWNLSKLKWEMVDMGSLNGTHLNSQPVHLPYSGRRQWSEPIELASGDIITLGTMSRVSVHITPLANSQIPFQIGMASDPMALRRGGKILPMEDACYIRWPLPELDQFGLFAVFDGHGGAGAAKTASEMLPKVVAEILSITDTRERVLSVCDASEVLKDAFFKTEATMNHQYEGCTATVLLVWANRHDNFFAQCANVGDSACIMNIGDNQITMSEDHRITSPSERARLRSMGPPIRDGETRLCGLNIARMLGDKFLKEQEPRFSSEPYVSRPVHIPQGSEAFTLMASDGLWDVITVKKAVQLVIQARERFGKDEKPAEKVANFVLGEARTLRTRDNTSVIFLDFNTKRTASCN